MRLTPIVIDLPIYDVTEEWRERVAGPLLRRLAEKRQLILLMNAGEYINRIREVLADRIGREYQLCCDLKSDARDCNSPDSMGRHHEMLKFRGRSMVEFARCDDCGKYRNRVHSCTFDGVVFDGKEYRRAATHHHGRKMTPDSSERCYGCGVLLRASVIHHFVCDDEECPKCRGQLISCHCDVTEVLQIKGSGRADKSEWKLRFVEILPGKKYKPSRKRH